MTSSWIVDDDDLYIIGAVSCNKKVTFSWIFDDDDLYIIGAVSCNKKVTSSWIVDDEDLYITRSPGALAGGPSGLLTSSFAPSGAHPM